MAEPEKRRMVQQAEMTRSDWKKSKEARKQELKRLKELKLLKKLEKERAEKEKAQKDPEGEKEEKGRLYTVTVALPGSVLDNAQSPELRTYLAGQIARACTVFCVDEIVVFDEQGEDAKSVEGEFRGIGKKGQASVQLARILQYLECPQYLRKSFFPKHKDLQFAGLLNPLDSPHHMRIDEESPYREGVVVDRPFKPQKGSYVNCGMRKEIQIDRQLQAGLRVTVRLHKSENSESNVLKGTVVAPHAPRTESAVYWGYTVRLASCLSAVFTECPFKDGYDLSIGTSERGSNIDNATLPSFRLWESLERIHTISGLKFSDVQWIWISNPTQHMLVMFGGLQGLEASVDADQNLSLADPSALFHHYLNTCPGQGSRTIRTEEAILITLSALRPKIDTAVGRSTSS